MKDIRLITFPGIVSKVAMNLAEQVSVEENVKSFGHMATRGIIGLYGRSIFCFLRFVHTDSHSDWASLQPKQQ